MRRLALAALFLTTSSLAHADEAARDHFQHGQALYEGSRYDAALREFEAAYAMQPMPALLYDIARCLERLERKEEAAAAYERYLNNSPNVENTAEIRERIADLRRKPSETEVVLLSHIDLSPPPAAAPKRRYIVPASVGGGALVFGIVGAGLFGSAAHDYGALRSSCSPTCSPSLWSALPAREHAGEALLGIAAAAVVVDIVLWVRAARRK